MSRGFKPNDELIFLERIDFGNELTEAIIVVCEFKWLDEYFAC